MTSSPDQRLKLAKEYLAERKERNPARTPSRTWVNSMMPSGSLIAPQMSSARAEADQHFDCLSAPMAAQIVRTV